MRKTEKSLPKSKKDKILAAAIYCFAKSGVAQTRLSEIAKKAGVDQPLLNYYYPDLNSLYIEVVTHVLEVLRDYTYRAIAKHEDDPIKLLSAYVRAPFQWGRDEPELFSIWSYFYYLATMFEPFRQLNDSIRVTGRQRIQIFIYRGIEKKAFTLPYGLSVEDLAFQIQGLITGNALMAGTESGIQWDKFADQTTKTILNLLGAHKST